MAATLLWLRRDFRLHDHAALQAAVARGKPIIPVVIADALDQAMGAAPRWRWAQAIRHFAAQWAGLGGQVILRQGAALPVLQALVAETGADAVFWTRYLHPEAIARDKVIKATLSAAGILAKGFDGQLLFNPWAMETHAGGPYRVYTPFWKACRAAPAPAHPIPAPASILHPRHWPESLALEAFCAPLERGMNRGAAVVAAHAVVGEAAAQARLQRFIDKALATYREQRDFPDRPATSGLSENLAWGEISPHRLWWAVTDHIARYPAAASGGEHFLKELVWREFAWHLAFHTPHILTRNWRSEWDHFPWRADNPDAERWRRGQTGEPMVDAAMRQMYVTGVMHNRCRMIVASYLTKHLLTDWRVGAAWFADCLIDWDPASNAMGWQWTAGSGPDAAPYFRIYNPATQAEKFDPNHRYRAQWLAGWGGARSPTAQSYFAAVPRAWALDEGAPPPRPLIALEAGRARALAAYEDLRKGAG